MTEGLGACGGNTVHLGLLVEKLPARAPCKNSSSCGRRDDARPSEPVYLDRPMPIEFVRGALCRGASRTAMSDLHSAEIQLWELT
jgi:hypothetical protein